MAPLWQRRAPCSNREATRGQSALQISDRRFPVIGRARASTARPRARVMSDYPNFSALADVAAEDGRTWHPSRNGHGPALLEMGGDELVASDLSMDDLAYLPMLGASGYFVLDWSHLVSGYPRVGKTELLVALTREWLGEGHEVLYITEEPAAMWGSRLAGASGDW